MPPKKPPKNTRIIHFTKKSFPLSFRLCNFTLWIFAQKSIDLWKVFSFAMRTSIRWLPAIVLYVIILSRTSFRVNLHSIVAWMSRNSSQAPYLKFKRQQQNSNPQPLVRKRTLNHLAKLAKWECRFTLTWHDNNIRSNALYK